MTPTEHCEHECCEHLILDLIGALTARSFIDTDGDYHPGGLSHDEIWDIFEGHRKRYNAPPAPQPQPTKGVGCLLDKCCFNECKNCGYFSQEKAQQQPPDALAELQSFVSWINDTYHFKWNDDWLMDEIMTHLMERQKEITRIRSDRK